jgi:hypothetical protein
MAIQNPFRPTRFEHHDHPLIWLSPNVQSLEGLKSVYVAGTRGSGKTSLLKAINWRERLFNPTVRDQLGDELSDYVAVYFRLPDYLTSAIGLIDWEKSFPESVSPELVGYELFSQLIELVAAQLICEAISSLRSSQRFSYTPGEEEALVTAVVSRFPAFKKIIGPALCSSLDDLSVILQSMHQRLNILITRGQVKEAFELALEVQPGVFINELGKMIRELACKADGACSPNFHLKICIDDCETLHPLQQRFLNSLVRSSKNPLFWVISFVSVDYDSTTTVHLNQTLSDADRTQLILDDMKPHAFYRLCEEVSLLRIYYSVVGNAQSESLQNLPKNFFALEALLGKVTLDSVLLNLAMHSLSAEFAELVERSRDRKKQSRNSVPPIYETYVLEKLGDRLIDERPENKSAYMRRKQVAAYLAICSEYRISNIPYVGARTVVSMSNLCIRDYLELLGAIFDEAVKRKEIRSLADLLQRETPLSLDTQSNGVRSSSRQKFDGIRNSMERDSAEAMRTVEFLGKLTARLQSNHAAESTLATPERGHFIFDFKSVDERNPQGEVRKKLVTRVLRRCEADGLLRPSKTFTSDDAETYELAFYLHRRFAAEFRFSYRGPYAYVRMPMAEFIEVCEGGSANSVDELVDRAYNQIQKVTPSDHPKLF